MTVRSAFRIILILFSAKACPSRLLAFPHGGNHFVTICPSNNYFAMPWQYTVEWTNSEHVAIQDISVSFPLIHRSQVGYPISSVRPVLTVRLRLDPVPMMTTHLIGQLKGAVNETDQRLKYRFSSDYPSSVAARGFLEPLRPLLNYHDGPLKMPILNYQPHRKTNDPESYFEFTSQNQSFNQQFSYHLNLVNVVLRRKAFDTNLLECLEEYGPREAE